MNLTNRWSHDCSISLQTTNFKNRVYFRHFFCFLHFLPPHTNNLSVSHLLILLLAALPPLSHEGRSPFNLFIPTSFLSQFCLLGGHIQCHLYLIHLTEGTARAIHKSLFSGHRAWKNSAEVEWKGSSEMKKTQKVQVQLHLSIALKSISIQRMHLTW